MTFIALIITINGQIVGALPYPDAMSCGNALPAVHAALINQHPDTMVQCKDSGVPKVRPRARPENLNKQG
jgi:hypothetical protein